MGNIVGTMARFIILIMALVLSFSFIQFVSCQRRYPTVTRNYSRNRNNNLNNFKPFNNGRSQRRTSYTSTSKSNRRSYNTNQKQNARARTYTDTNNYSSYNNLPFFILRGGTFYRK